MFSLISSAQAQEAVVATAKQPNAFMSFIPFILIFVVMYFLMIKPQKKRMEQEQKFIGELKKGDEVYTKSGLIGVVSGMTDKIVTLEVAEGVKVKVLKTQVGGAAKPLLETTPVKA